MPRLCPGCGCGGRGSPWPCGGDGLGGPRVVFLGPGGKMKHVARQRLCLVLGGPAAWRWKGRGGSGTWCPSHVPPHVPSWHRWAHGALVFPNGEKPKEAEKKGSGSMVFPFCVHRCVPACSQVRSSSLRKGTGGGLHPQQQPPLQSPRLVVLGGNWSLWCCPHLAQSACTTNVTAPCSHGVMGGAVSPPPAPGLAADVHGGGPPPAVSKRGLARPRREELWGRRGGRN